MAINQLISIKNPIVDAIDQLGLDHEKDTPVFTRWASLAEKEINSYFQYEKKRAVLDITNCVAKIPTDCRYVQRAVLGDLGCDCADLFNNLCSLIPISSVTLNASAASTGFLIVDMGAGFTEILGSIPHVIQDNKIILNQNLDGQKLTIQGLFFQRDEDGFLKVGQNHVQAITWNLIWRHYFRKSDLNSLEYGKMKMAKDEWDRECLNARAKDAELTESEREAIAQMLYDPYTGGRGLEIGMSTTLQYGWYY